MTYYREMRKLRHLLLYGGATPADAWLDRHRHVRAVLGRLLALMVVVYGGLAIMRILA